MTPYDDQRDARRARSQSDWAADAGSRGYEADYGSEPPERVDPPAPTGRASVGRATVGRASVPGPSYPPPAEQPVEASYDAQAAYPGGRGSYGADSYAADPRVDAYGPTYDPYGQSRDPYSASYG